MIPLAVVGIGVIRKTDKHDVAIKALEDWAQEHDDEDRAMHNRFADMRVAIEGLTVGFASMKKSFDDMRDDLRGLAGSRRK